MARRKPNSKAVARIRDRLRAAGLRSTQARAVVLQELEQATSPRTHAELSETLVPLGFDKATVYRNLIDLTEAGLVARTELGDHVWRFELRDEAHADEPAHPHFVCTECGSVTCMAEVQLTPQAKRRAAEVGQITEILLRGQCLNCC